MEKDMKLLEKYMKRLSKKYPTAYVSGTMFGKDAYVNVTYRKNADVSYDEEDLKTMTTWEGKYNDQL